MGATESKSTKYKNIAKAFEQDLEHIISNYQVWTNPNMCNNIGVFYSNKIIKFHQDDLLDLATSVGIMHNTNVQKQKLCNEIILYYKQKLLIIKLIYDTVYDIHKKLHLATNGPVCRGIDKFISEIHNCEQYKGNWLEQSEYKEIVQNSKPIQKDGMKQISRKQLWNEHIKTLEETYDNNKKELLRIVNIIKNDIDNKIKLDELDKLKEETEQITNKFTEIVNTLYLIIVNV